MPSRSSDQAIADLADKQHGVVSRDQLFEMGLRRRAIECRVESGNLHPLHRGVYKLGYRRASREGQWMAAVLASGPGACLSHRSAARLWLLLPSGEGQIEVTVPPTRRVRRQGITAHQAVVPGDEREVRDAIPATSPFRTLFDLAAVLDRRKLERALHEAEVRGLRDRIPLPVLLERYPGARGAQVLRAVLSSNEPAGITRSDLEEAFVALIEAHDLPRPRLNAHLALRGRFFEVDALWRSQRVALELDGRSVHGTSKKFESDRQRDRILLAEGWRTMRITWRQMQDEADQIVADLSRALYP